MKEKIESILLDVKHRIISTDDGVNAITKLIDKKKNEVREDERLWSNFKVGDMK